MSGREKIDEQLKSGNLSGFYLLYGDEDYLKAHYCARIAEKAVPSGLENLNLYRFDSGNFDFDNMIGAVMMIPLTGSRKCVILRDIDPDSMSAADWKRMQEVLKEAPPECTIVYHFDSVKTDRKSGRLKWLQSFGDQNGASAEINKMQEGELIKYIIALIKRHGCEAGRSEASHIFETCGDDLNALRCEIEKICAYAGSGRITREQIDAVAVKPLNASIYDLARAMTYGRLGDGLRILSELFYKKVEPVIILSALSGAFCDLYRAKAAQLSGAGQQQIVGDFHYLRREFRVKNALRDCRDADIQFLRRVLGLLMHTDGQIKSTGADRRIVIEQLLFEISALQRGRR